MSLDRLAHPTDFVAGEVVADDDIAGTQCRAQHLLDIGKERRSVDRAVEHQGRHQSIMSKAAEKGRRVPMTIRDRRYQALAAPRAAVAARHVRRGPGLVQEDQPRSIELWL